MTAWVRLTYCLLQPSCCLWLAFQVLEEAETYRLVYCPRCSTWCISNAFHKHFELIDISSSSSCISPSVESEGRGRRWEIFHPVVHSTKACKGWSWAMLKPRSRNAIWVCQEGGSNPIIWVTMVAFLDTLAGSWIISEVARTYRSSHLECYYFRCLILAPVFICWHFERKYSE